MSETIQLLSIHTSFDPQIDDILFAGQAQTNALHNMGPLIHPYYIVHYVIAGKGEMKVGGNTYSLSSGDSFFIFPGESVQYTANKHEPWQYCWIGFKGNRFKHILQRSNISAKHPIVQSLSIEHIHPFFERIITLLSSNELYSSIEASGHLQLLLAKYCQAKEPMKLRPFDHKATAERQIEEAIAYIDYHYPQPITIEELAQRVGYHRSHLCKLFKLTTGISPLAYLIKVRLEQAQLLLAQHIPVNQVAQAVGFNDALYFSKLFKRHNGISPTEFEKQYGH